MARYTVIENNDTFAKVVQDGAEDTFSAYIMDGDPTDPLVTGFSKAARGFETEVHAAQWAHDYITNR